MARQRLHKSGFAINAHTALTAVKGAMQETGLSGLTSHGQLRVKINHRSSPVESMFLEIGEALPLLCREAELM